MHDWGVWDWAGFIALWVTVALSATDQALKLLPELAQRVEPRAMRARMWFRAILAFAPLGFLILATLIFVGRSTDIFGGSAAVALDKARLDVARIEPILPTASDNQGLRVNIYTINTSDVVISGMTDNYRFEYPSKALTKDEDDSLMKSVLAGTPEPPTDGGEISPHQNGPWYTARDPRLTLEEWNEILADKKLAYLFVAMKYRALSHTKATEYCIIFSTGYPAYLLCPDNNKIFTIN
jgi:hypothetical protein